MLLSIALTRMEEDDLEQSEDGQNAINRDAQLGLLVATRGQPTVECLQQASNSGRPDHRHFDCL